MATPSKGTGQGAGRWGCHLVGPALLSRPGLDSPARAGWTGPVPFKFFTGSAGTLRGEEKRLQPRPPPHQKIRGLRFAFWLWLVAIL